MKNRKTVGLLCALALAAAFATESAAQGSHDGQAAASGNGKAAGTEGATKNPPDMRLWSFGDCDNKFPFVNSEERKECVRVVGSEEARDARAYRVCETSNARDPEEVSRCKSTYKANKDHSAQSGYAPSAGPQAQAQPTAADLQRVRAIAVAAVERDKAAAAAPAAGEAQGGTPDPETPPPPPEESGSSTLVITLIAGVLVRGGIFVARRRQAGMLSAR